MPIKRRVPEISRSASTSSLPSPPTSPSKAVPLQESFLHLSQRANRMSESMTSLDEAGVAVTLSSIKTPVDPNFLHSMQKGMDRELIIALQEKIPRKIKRLKQFLRQPNVDDVEFTLEYYDFLHTFTALLHWLQSRKPAYSSGTTLIASVQEEMYNTIATGLQICSKYFADAYAWMWKAAQTTHAVHPGMAVAAYAPVPAGAVYPSMTLQVPHVQLTGGLIEAQAAQQTIAMPQDAVAQMAAAGLSAQLIGGMPVAAQVHHPSLVGAGHAHMYAVAGQSSGGGIGSMIQAMKTSLVNSGFLKTACIWSALGCAAGAALMVGGGPSPSFIPQGLSQRELTSAAVGLAAAAALVSQMASGDVKKRGPQALSLQQMQNAAGAAAAGLAGSSMQYEVIATAGRPSFWLARLLGATPSGQQWWVQWFEDGIPALPDGSRQYTLGGTQLIPVSAVFARRIPTIESVGGVFTVDAGTVQQLQSLHDDLVPHLGTPPQTPANASSSAAAGGAETKEKDESESSSSGSDKETTEKTAESGNPPAKLTPLPCPVGAPPVALSNGTRGESSGRTTENDNAAEKEGSEDSTAEAPSSPLTEPDANAGGADVGGESAGTQSPRVKDEVTSTRVNKSNLSPPGSPRSPRSGRKVEFKSKAGQEEDKKSPVNKATTTADGSSAGSSTKPSPGAAPADVKGAAKEKAAADTASPSNAATNARRPAVRDDNKKKTDDVMEAITRGEKRHVLLTMLRLCHLALSDFHNNRETIFNASNAPQTTEKSNRDFLYV